MSVKSWGAVALSSAMALVCGAADFKTVDSFVTLQGNASYFVQATNWTDLAGNPVDVPPTNANDTAYITGSTDSSSGKRNLRTIPLANNANIKTGGGNCTRIDVGRIYADYRALLHLGTQTGYGCPAQTLSVADPDDFPGFWSSYSGRGNIELRATAEHSPALSHYDILGYMAITVPNAGTSASVESLFRSGALNKMGEGNLTVKQGAGCDSRIYCSTGTVTLTGLPDALYDGGLPKAWLHLDATRKDTMTTFMKDGRECLARWNDCDGGAVYASTNFPDGRLGIGNCIPYVHPPYLTAKASPSGLDLVDFGVTDCDVASGLPSNCVLTTSEKLTTAKEFFFAAKCSSTATGRDNRAIIGTVGSAQYLGYGPIHLLNTYSCNPAWLESRHITFNGMQVHPLALNNANGPFVTRHGVMPRDFSVISLADGLDATFDLIGSDSGESSNTGGWQLGELLVYDRVLTADERLKINRYLMAKWQKNVRPDEVGEVVLNDATAINVPAGRTVRIKSLTTLGSKIVKQGAGRLIVDGVAPAGVKLDIQGGSLTVKTPEVVAQPAANPYFWIDATSTASLVMADGNEPGGTQYIDRWNDCNGGAVYAELPTDPDPYGDPKRSNVWLTDERFMGHKPWVAKGASPTGLDMIDFGILNTTTPSQSTQSFMQLNPHGTANAYCGFIVVKAYNATIQKQYFGTSNTDLLQMDTRHLANANYTLKDTLGAAWAINGCATDPLAIDMRSIYTTNCLVVSFANETSKLRADLLAKYTFNQEGSGSQKIGEMLLYDRPLSAEERRNTEAYLMKKWLGVDHPESAAGFKATYKYPADKPVVVDNDADVTIAAEGGNGALVKRGTGTATLNSLATVSNYVAFAAEGGSLTVKLDLPDDAFYRYDASDLDSFTSTYLTDDGNGGQITNILKWADQITGNLAQSAHIDGFSPKYGGYSGGTCTNPTLKYVEMPDGVARPTVDFGEYNNVAWIWKDTTSPVPLGSLNSSAGITLPGWSDTGKYRFREVHAVYADRPKDDGTGLDTRMMILTTQSANPITKKTQECLWRGSSGALFKGATYDKTTGDLVADSAFVSAGVIHKDGVAVPHTETLGSGFHLISVQPTNYINVSAISMDRNCNAGGCYVSEYVAYTEKHTPEVFAYLEGKLMRKWFGAERPVWLTPFEKLTAAADATLTLDTDTKVTAAELAGAGTIAAPEIGGVSSLALVAPDETLEATGTVTLADTGVVSFTEAFGKLAAGSYTVFSAATLLNAEALQNWTLDAEVPGTRRASLAVVDNSVVLKVEKAGMILLVR